MNGSYAQHAADTKEFGEGYLETDSSKNPYTSGSKQWLDWLIGFETGVAELITIANYNYLMALANNSFGL